MIDDISLPDATAATREMMMLDADLLKLVTGPDDVVNVYCQELPNSMQMAEAVPQNAVVIQDCTGAPGRGGFNRLKEPYFNLFTMGETPELAKHVYLRCHEILRQARRQVVGECLIHSYEETNPPEFKRDPQTKWPYFRSVWKFLSSDQQAT